MAKARDNEFLETLRRQRQARQGRATPQRATVILKEFCQGVAAFSDDALRCFLDPGYRVNMGQEWKVVVKSKATGARHVLLRVYCAENDTGFPVTLNRYEDELVPCPNEAALRRELKKFLENQWVLEAIDLIAAPSSPRP